MQPEETRVVASQMEKPSHQGRKRLRVVAIVLGLAAVVALMVLSRPNGATYDEYLQLKEGMTKKEVAAIIGEGDYWRHYEGDREVTRWVNKDGTYVKAVFDKNEVLVEVSWESGPKPQPETE